MQIGILSSDKSLYSTKRLKEAAIKAGHEVEIVDYNKCYMNITSSKPTMHAKGGTLKTFDAIIPRIGPKKTFGSFPFLVGIDSYKNKGYNAFIIN